MAARGEGILTWRKHSSWSLLSSVLEESSVLSRSEESVGLGRVHTGHPVRSRVGVREGLRSRVAAELGYRNLKAT